MRSTRVIPSACARAASVSGDRIAVTALVAASAAFALAVWVVRPSPVAPVAATLSTPDTSAVQRGVILHALRLPPGVASVDLEWMPERLTNEASPSSLRDVITVRGVPGLASVEAPAVISWTEAGLVYWLISPTRSTIELIRLADDLVP